MLSVFTAEKKKLRFTTPDDLVLLKETIGINPFENGRWSTVATNVVSLTGKKFSVRTVREHVFHLMKLWKRGDSANLCKSGTENQYQEKKVLIQEALILHGESERKKGMKRKSAEQGGASQRDDSLVMVMEEEVKPEIVADVMYDIADMGGGGSQRSTSTALPGSNQIKRSCVKEGFVQYLMERGIQDSTEKEKEREMRKEEMELKKRKMDLEERKMALEERKLALEERKLALEEEDKNRRMKLEAKEQEDRLKSSEQQRKIFEILLQKFCDS